MGHDASAVEIRRVIDAKSAQVSPNGPRAHSVVARKLAKMHDEGPNLAPDDLMKITARTLVMVADDDDEVALEHAVAGLIGGGSGLARPGEASLAHATIRKCP